MKVDFIPEKDIEAEANYLIRCFEAICNCKSRSKSNLTRL
jgi:hypothetical protein